MQFMQIVRFATDRFAEVKALMDEWVNSTQGRRSAQRGIVGRDREHPGRYAMVVEFPSQEEAMTNSALPETSAFAEKLGELCSSAPVFENLDLVRLDDLVPSSAAGSPRVGRATRCPCGVEFRVDSDEGIDHLVAAVQQHAAGSHGHDVSREHILAELTST